MARSRRENLLIIGVSVAVGLFALDRYVLTPFNEKREDLAVQHQRSLEKIGENRTVLNRDRDLRKVWAEMSAVGLEASPADAERLMLHALRGWTKESGVQHVSLRPERSNLRGFVKVSVDVKGSGPTASLAKLLWAVESAKMPIRIENVQVTPSSSKEGGGDDLQMQLTISRLCAVEELQKKGGSARPTVAAASIGGGRK
jgi:hypothetical protein